jgi:hypothetical protein
MSDYRKKDRCGNASSGDCMGDSVLLNHSHRSRLVYFRKICLSERLHTELRMGCAWAQGYGIARPMPAAALPDWIAAYQGDPSWVGETKSGT